MKKWFFVAAALLALAGCDDVKPDHAAINIQVAPQQVTCTGTTKQRCFRVKVGEDAAWQLYYGNIVGFDFQPGFRYELKVRQQHQSQQDQSVSQLQWKLVRVISKQAAKPQPAAAASTVGASS